MSFTYGDRPLTSPTDALRLRIGDVYPDEPIFQDGEIQYFLARNNNDILSAALDAARTMRAMWSRLVDERAGNVGVNLSQRQANLDKLIESLEEEQVMYGEGQFVFAGGISYAQNMELEQDADAIQPAFTANLMQTFGKDSADGADTDASNLLAGTDEV